MKTHGVGKASIQTDLKTKMVMSIIVPCLNEEEVLPLFYQTLEVLIPKLGVEIEYVFVDDSSSDGTL
ncbi:MAG: glycosyltransferase, partial [Streptococcus mitis]|nr:glycosyltransferase [Streptococcus mitis]